MLRIVFWDAGSGLNLLHFELELGTFYPQSHGDRSGDGNRRNPLPLQVESIRAAEIADRPLPVLKDNLRMGSADERIVD